MKLTHGPKLATRAGLITLASIGALALPITSMGAPSARITASRTSGPAPLAVMFDATGTTDSATDAFRNLGYRFSFADAGAGTWAYSDRSKNEQIGGPLAAHVFERAGTYSVQVTAKDAAGATSTATVTITVTDPNSTYSGTRTVCLSRTSDFAGCPSGAQQIANASSYPAFQSNTRYLLHRGQDFSSLGSLRVAAGSVGIADSQFGAFGSGAKPIIGSASIVSGSGGDANWYRRVTIMDLDAVNIGSDNGGFGLLLLRNSVTRGGMIELAGAFGYWFDRATSGEWRAPDEMFIIENTVDRNFNASTNPNPNGITAMGGHIVVMGNSVDRTHEHNVRLWQAHKTIVAHNRLTGHTSGSIRHALKIHSSGTGAISTLLSLGTSYNFRSADIVIADNELGSDRANINWLAVTSPQNGESAEGIERVIWEDNEFRYGSNYVSDITWAGRNMIGRGNRNITANRNASYGVGHADSLPADWRGPYMSSDQSMKLRFSGTADKIPGSPSALRVE